MTTTRRTLIATAATMPLLSLAACTTGLGGGISLAEAIRRLLTLSSQRAFTLLLAPGGFYESEVARIALPPQFANSRWVLGQILNSSAVRLRVQRLLNDAAGEGARRAAPVVAQAIGALTVADALGVLRGGPTAATSVLERSMGGALITTMFPEVGNALRLANDDLVARSIAAVTGYDVAALARDVTASADRGIWAAMAREEAAIRANPSSANDPLLLAVLTAAG